MALTETVFVAMVKSSSVLNTWKMPMVLKMVQLRRVMLVLMTVLTANSSFVQLHDACLACTSAEEAHPWMCIC